MLKINTEQTTEQIIKFLQTTVKKAGFKKVVVSLSGGLDSATVTFLAVKALGPENVLVVEMPHRDFNKDHDGQLVIDKLQIPKENVFESEISGIVESFLSNLGDLSDLRLGNLMARVRMILLYDLAKKYNYLVCGTENKSEYLLGYFTRFGDSASDLEPIRNLYKTQVMELAKELGVPEKIIKKAPTAGLWQNQTDENEMGFSYQEADPILVLHFDEKKSWEEIMKMGVDKQLVEKVKNQVEKNAFKRVVPIIYNF